MTPVLAEYPSMDQWLATTPPARVYGVLIVPDQEAQDATLAILSGRCGRCGLRCNLSPLHTLIVVATTAPEQAVRAIQGHTVGAAWLLQERIASPAGYDRILRELHSHGVTDGATQFVHTTSAAVASEVVAERKRQYTRFGGQSHPDSADPWPTLGSALERSGRHSLAVHGTTWAAILAEEVGGALQSTGPALRAELIQVAAVAVEWVEAIDRRAGSGAPTAPSPVYPLHGPKSDRNPDRAQAPSYC